jgi:hypothetical protein
MDVKINGLSKEKSRKLIIKCIGYKSISCDIDEIHYSFKNFIELYKNINKIAVKEVEGIVIIDDNIYLLNNKLNDYNYILDSINESYSSLSLQFI